jgi:hypothetical protein
MYHHNEGIDDFVLHQSAHSTHQLVIIISNNKKRKADTPKTIYIMSMIIEAHLFVLTFTRISESEGTIPMTG